MDLGINFPSLKASPLNLHLYKFLEENTTTLFPNSVKYIRYSLFILIILHCPINYHNTLNNLKCDSLKDFGNLKLQREHLFVVLCKSYPKAELDELIHKPDFKSQFVGLTDVDKIVTRLKSGVKTNVI